MGDIVREKLDSLQALRALAFLGIFFQHATFFISWSAMGVSVFYVMSGFLMVYTYGTREFDVSLKNNISFSIKKIRKLYSLHIITMIFAVILNIVTMIDGMNTRNILILLRNIGLNITLLQTWVPDSGINVSLNGVAWYLSVTLFLYFMFPYILQVINKWKVRVLWKISTLILVVEIILCIPFIIVLGIKSPVYIWFMYCFPIFRLGDFFIGCCLGKTFLNVSTKELDRAKATIYEILATCITIAVSFFVKQNYDNVILQALQNWTTIYIPVAAIWVYLFVMNKGLITNLLVNKVLINLGNISAYAFLIHYVVTRYTSRLLLYFNIELHGVAKVVLVLIELLCSIMLSLLYQKLKDRRKRSRCNLARD